MFVFFEPISIQYISSYPESMRKSEKRMSGYSNWFCWTRKTSENCGTQYQFALGSISIKMAKFTVLQSNQRLISLVCGIDIGQKAKSTGSFFTSIPVYSLLFILSNVALSFAVKTSINSYDLMARITAASIVIAYCQAITIFLQTGLRMQQFIGLIQTFQTIVDDEGIVAVR